MNQQTGFRLPSFYLTEQGPCPYVEGLQERKLFTHLVGDGADALNNELTHAGFRRSQAIAYRPACENCFACRSVRICVDAFTPKASMRRVLNRNAGLTRNICPPHATREQYDLLRLYLDARHADGGMVDMTSLDYMSMVEDTHVTTHILEYRTEQGELVAGLLRDTLDDGFSLVYSFFHPDHQKNSLGSFIILDSIAQAREIGLAYVYLGYLVSSSCKMAYKARYQPMEELGPDGWTPMADSPPAAFANAKKQEQ